MNLQAAIKIFQTTRLEFGNALHIAARNVLRTAARSRKAETKDDLKSLRNTLRYFHGAQ
jgi:hypothetical protein